MLDDPRAIEIIKDAQQRNVAQPNRSDRDFRHILEDFFEDHDFTGQRILELGPGQWDFARMVRDRGGVCAGIDQDPAVLALGRYLGFETYEGMLQEFDFGPLRGQFDGLFCKFSMNAFWWEGVDQAPLITAIHDVLRPDGWGWIAPWNGRHKTTKDNSPLAAQIDAFETIGWRVHELTPEQVSAYGMGGRVENHVLFERGLVLRGRAACLEHV